MPSPGFAKMDLQLQNDFLIDLIQRQDESLKRQAKLIDELHGVIQKQAVENISEGSKFKGYQEYLVQGLEIKRMRFLDLFI